MQKTLALLFLFAVTAISADVVVGNPETAGCNPLGIG